MTPHIINAGSSSDQMSISLSTRNRNWIPNEQRQGRVPSAMQAAKVMMLKQLKSGSLRVLRAEYNCMGMVFANRRTCIEPEHFSMIASDDGYRQVQRQAEAVPGDVVAYRGGKSGQVEHVGLIVEVDLKVADASVSIRVLSQFGADGEYFHQADDVPLQLGTGAGVLKLEIWTDR